MIKPLRIIDSGDASAVRSHALYHGLAAAFAAGDPPILSLVSPSEPHLSIGMHQDFAAEIDAIPHRTVRHSFFGDLRPR